MPDITVEIDSVSMNVYLIKLMGVYESIGILFEYEAMMENYVFLQLIKAGMPLKLDVSGQFRVLYGALDIGVNTLNNNPLYIWRDRTDEGEVA